MQCKDIFLIQYYILHSTCFNNLFAFVSIHHKFLYHCSMKRIYFLILTLATLVACKSKPTAELVIHNAHIFLCNSTFDTATAMVISDGKIISIGNDSLLNQYYSTKIIDAKGAYIYPGFIDAHCHFTGYAMDKYKLALFGTNSYDEMIEKTVNYAKTNTRFWIEGRGWDQNDWVVKDFPNKDTLDKLFPNNPVYLLRIDGHAVLCNQKALDIAGICTETIIEGGEILKKNNQLTGILIDNAVDIVKAKIPQRSEEEIITDLIEAQTDCVAYGLTGVVDCGISDTVFQYLQKAYREKKLAIRSSVMLSNTSHNLEKYLQSKPFRNDFLHLIGYKVYADGALGSRGAYMLEPYSDRPHHYGFLLTPLDSIELLAKKLVNTDYQLCIHAIGDKANREVLKIFAKILKQKNDKKWRIEHAQVVDDSDMHYFGDYNIIPSVQPTHATSDMYWAGDRLGENRIHKAYAYKQLLEQNNWLPLGTDFPVESINPFNTFAAAVFRSDKNHFPQGGFLPQNALTRKEALWGITLWAAMSVKEDDVKGSLEIGKYADFIICPINLLTASIDEIYNANVTSTFINGKLVYDKK